MQKAELQNSKAKNQPVVRQAQGAAIESSQGEQIAQLESMMDGSPQSEKLGGLAAMVNASPAMAAQRKLADALHNSPPHAAQKKAFDAIRNSPQQTAQQNIFNTIFGAAQRVEETEPLQGKFDAVQRTEDEPPLQGKFSFQTPAQLEQQTAGKSPNNTGLPDNLKSGIKNLSGLSMDNVRVHYNSSQPAQLNALAYAQGTDIHVAPGQEQHLPHEAWHVVQQAQEADSFGRRAAQMMVGQESRHGGVARHERTSLLVMQRQSHAATVQRTVVNTVGGRWEDINYETHRSSDSTGAKISLEFTPGENSPMDVKIGLIQTVTALRKGRPDPGGFEVMPLDEQSGRAIDRGTNNPNAEPTSPVYGADNTRDKKATKLSDNLPNNEDAAYGIRPRIGDPKPAMLYDKPGSDNDQGIAFSKKFETTAVVLEGEQTGTYLGSVEWGYRRNADEKKVVLDPAVLTLKSMGDPSAEFIASAKAWNAQKPDKNGDKLVPIPIPGEKKDESLAKKGCCFLTTACVQHRGLDDDCRELTVLRGFRDGYLSNQPGGPDLIKAYYKCAPGLVEAILNSANSDDVLNRIYQIVVLCVEHIDHERFESALNTYRAMVEELLEEFMLHIGHLSGDPEDDGDSPEGGRGVKTISGHVLAFRQPFAKSDLWKFQAQYFEKRGAEAWRLGEVPHYVTSNPVIADAYAEMVFSFWRDRQALFPGDAPLHVCELGAGSGRFAFYFIKRLLCLCTLHSVPPHSFRYVLTDFTQSNLDAWRGHPSFGGFFESGMLDMALFDVNHPGDLELQISGRRLDAGTLRGPLVVIANYLFDTVPQALYYFKDRRAHECLLSLAVDEDPEGLDAAALLERLRLRYDYQPCAASPEEAGLLTQYAGVLDDAHVLVPAAGLRCLRRLREIAPEGVFLLSADKGEHRIEQVGMQSPPSLVHHGSFSLSVNYHAFKVFCEQSGGVALLQERKNDSVEIAGLLMVERAAEHGETLRTWRSRVQDFSPGEYLAVSQHARAHIPEMHLAAMLAYVRLGLCDSHIFGHYLPRLRELAPEFDADARSRLAELMDEVWEMYFPLGENRDMAYDMACLLYEMDEYPRALRYFEHSLQIYGPHTGTYCNMAACHHQLGQPEQAESLARKVMQTDPENGAARELLDMLAHAR